MTNVKTLNHWTISINTLYFSFFKNMIAQYKSSVKTRKCFNFDNLLRFVLCSQSLLGLECHICVFPCTSHSHLWYKTYGHMFDTTSCTSKSTQKPTQSNDGYLSLFNHLSWLLWSVQIDLAIVTPLLISTNGCC